MTTWWHGERLGAVLEAVRATGARSVLDLGCGAGDFLALLVGEPQVERIVGIDLAEASLAKARVRLADARVTIRAGSMLEADATLAGFDCAVMVETIEHVDPGDLHLLERAVFGTMRPRHAIVTTPNAEFNGLLGVPKGRFRHPDHRFEWDRARFRRWAGGVAGRCGYRVAFRDVGGAHPDLGGASQMALFDLV